MEMGMGFLMGALAGAIFSLIVAVIIVASRRAVKPSASSTPAPAATPGPREPSSSVSAKAATRSISSRERPGADPEHRPSGHTVIVAEMESRDKQLNKSSQEVRDLLLGLAGVIGSTENESGKATKAFTSAKDIIHNIDLTDSAELAEAQHALINEIDRVLKSNIALHGELDKANRGIAEQRRQIEELRVQARVDALTRIPNRAAFDERLKEFVALLRRTNLMFTLMLIDIDHFKRVNDTHGHINGDRILRGLAAKISACVRNNDFAARYGGEEFAVIFPGTGVKDAMLVAERMRQDIAKTNFRLDGQNIKMTISGGLAECDKSMEPEDIIAAADNALYHAKNEGRNRMMIDDGKTPEKAANKT